MDDQIDRVTTVSYVENAQAVNFDRAEQDLLFPKKPWKTREEYQKAEEEYKNQLKKAQMISDCVTEEESKMIQKKLERAQVEYNGS